MNEVTRTDDPAVGGCEPKPKQRRPWETPVLREILLDGGTDSGKPPDQVEHTTEFEIFGTPS